MKCSKSHCWFNRGRDISVIFQLSITIVTLECLPHLTKIHLCTSKYSKINTNVLNVCKGNRRRKEHGRGVPAETYLWPRNTSMMKLFCQHSSQLKVNYFCKKSPSQIFDRVLNKPMCFFSYAGVFTNDFNPLSASVALK